MTNDISIKNIRINNMRTNNMRLKNILLCFVALVFIVSCASKEAIEVTNTAGIENTAGTYAARRIGEDDVSEIFKEKLNDMYKGKKLSVLGDSISTYEGFIPRGYVNFFPLDGTVNDVNATWWKMLADDAGMEICGNSSSAGSTCIGDSLSPDEPKYACSDYRIDALIGEDGVYPDIIIVFMGTNDLLTSVPLGENDGTQAVKEGVIENFSDAYSLILDKLESKYPAAQIFCCTLPQTGDWGYADKPFVTFVNSLNLTAMDYNEIIKTIADSKGVRIIDLFDCGITDRNMHKYVTDGVHPNEEGMKMICAAAKAALWNW